MFKLTRKNENNHLKDVQGETEQKINPMMISTHYPSVADESVDIYPIYNITFPMMNNIINQSKDRVSTYPTLTYINNSLYNKLIFLIQDAIRLGIEQIMIDNLNESNKNWLESIAYIPTELIDSRGFDRIDKFDNYINILVRPLSNAMEKTLNPQNIDLIINNIVEYIYNYHYGRIYSFQYLYEKLNQNQLEEFFNIPLLISTRIGMILGNSLYKFYEEKETLSDNVYNNINVEDEDW